MTRSQYNCCDCVPTHRLIVASSLMFLVVLQQSTMIEARPHPSVLKSRDIEKSQSGSSGPPLWKNPCGVDYHGAAPGRHGFKNFLKPVKEQMRLTTAHMNRINRTEITKVYSPVINLTSQIHDNKLPQSEFEDYTLYRDKHPNMTKEKMAQQMLPKLYEKLQTYAIAFEKLLKMKLKTDSAKHIREERKHIFKSIQNYLRALICEVETGLNVTQTQLPRSIGMDAFRSENDWPEQSDLTSIYTRDVSTIREYKAVLDDWLKILREIDFIGRRNRNERASKVNKNGNLRRKNLHPNRKNGKKNHMNKNNQARRAHRRPKAQKNIKN